jgi:hypothetical protein
MSQTTPVRRHPFALRWLVVTLALGSIVAACGMLAAGTPLPTPADFAGVAADIGQRGIAIQHVVSGDPGCDDQALARTAISFQASGGGQAAPTKLYLYSFRDQATYERLRSAIDACARSYVTDATTFESIDASPFVLAGQGPWSPEFKSDLRDALMEAATKGG